MKTTINTTDINNSNELSHVSKLTGRTYQIGSLVCPTSGKLFDITVITDWHNDVEDSNFEIVSFYFGEYDYDTTEQYIASAITEEAKKPSLEVYCQEAQNTLCAIQSNWDSYCTTAQRIDPNGEWTEVAFTPDNLQALVNFYTEQVQELTGTPVEDTALVQGCYENFVSIDDIEPDAEYDDELTRIEVKATAPDNSYELQSYIVLTQNIAGCRTPSDTDGEIVKSVEISNAEYNLVSEAIAYAIEQVRSSNGDVAPFAQGGYNVTADDQLNYAQILENVLVQLNNTMTTDSTDIQIRS